MNKRRNHQTNWNAPAGVSPVASPSADELARLGYHLPDALLNNIEVRDGEMALGCVVMTQTGLRFERQPNADEWQQIGDVIYRLAKSVQWVIGDYLAYSDQWEYGVTYELVAEQTGYEVVSLRDMAYVCTNVQLSLRNDKLKFGHHRAVAKLAPHEQVEWLEKAAVGKWSISQLRKAIDVWLNGEPTPPLSPEQITVSEIRGQTTEMMGRAAKVRHDPVLRRELRDLFENALRLLDTWDEEG